MQSVGWMYSFIVALCIISIVTLVYLNLLRIYFTLNGDVAFTGYTCSIFFFSDEISARKTIRIEALLRENGRKIEFSIIYSKKKKAFALGFLLFFFVILLLNQATMGLLWMCTRLIEYNNTFPISRLPANFKKRGKKRENIDATYCATHVFIYFFFSYGTTSTCEDLLVCCCIAYTWEIPFLL